MFASLRSLGAYPGFAFRVGVKIMNFFDIFTNHDLFRLVLVFFLKKKGLGFDPSTPPLPLALLS